MRSLYLLSISSLLVILLGGCYKDNPEELILTGGLNFDGNVFPNIYTYSDNAIYVIHKGGNTKSLIKSGISGLSCISISHKKDKLAYAYSNNKLAIIDTLGTVIFNSVISSNVPQLVWGKNDECVYSRTSNGAIVTVYGTSSIPPIAALQSNMITDLAVSKEGRVAIAFIITGTTNSKQMKIFYGTNLIRSFNDVYPYNNIQLSHDGKFVYYNSSSTGYINICNIDFSSTPISFVEIDYDNTNVSLNKVNSTIEYSLYAVRGDYWVNDYQLYIKKTTGNNYGRPVGPTFDLEPLKYVW